METAIEQRPATSRPLWLSYVILGGGISAASTSAILVRYATDAPALAISFWRCLAGAAVLAPFAGRGIGRMERTGYRLPAIAGAFLAVHFASWISSLSLTTVASSVLLVSTTPIFVAVAARLFFRERLKSLGWMGIALAMAGTALVSGGGGLGGSSIMGDALALVGGATAGGYVMAGARARQDLGILEYAVVTYAAAAVLLLPVCVVAGVDLWGYGSETWWAIAGLIAGPQLLGHTVINLVLSEIDATTVSVMIMVEPVITIALAFVLLDEVPSLLVYPGGLAILAGIYLVSTQRPVEPVPE